ncbi:Fe(3+)-hydroxamate ABC transporter permease FhuB [Amorphus sp. 3PC139-8]|uniref:Fe(3+)-hydroxamate ABC transporter permease FhuB n=1 Tax=Amorphus sp. 3PC139-8 TaxID=2735676 RepID=UPI00345D20CD
MADVVRTGERVESWPAGRAVVVAGMLVLAGSALMLLNLSRLAPGGLSWSVFLAPDPENIDELVAHYSVLPRFVVALAAGAGLGLSGTILQQVLRNPLAEPATLGLFSGSRAALVVTMLWLPEMLGAGIAPVAMAGAVGVLGFVLLLARRHDFSPLFVILSGLVLSLCLEAFSSMMILAHFEELGSLLVWQAGSLEQSTWRPATVLCLVTLATLVLASLLGRLLTILGLDSDMTRSLGLSPGLARGLALAVAVGPPAFVAAQVGIVGFIGLAGAALAGSLGARRVTDRLVVAPLLAAGLLVVTDQGLLALVPGLSIPAGAVTALLGAPLLIWLVRRMRTGQVGRVDRHPIEIRLGHIVPAGRWLLLVAALAAAVIALALCVGRIPEGWQVATGKTFGDLLPLRLPRLVAAMGAGIMLGIAGSQMQRLTGNAMASPELLGVSSGAVLMLIPAAVFLPALGRSAMMAIAAVGAFAFLAVALRIGRRSAYAPDRMLLTGLALTALAGSLMAVAVYFGDRRITQILAWMSGSTYSVRPQEVAGIAVIAVSGICAVPLVGRWLEVLPLGDPVARAVGVPIERARLAVMAMAAGLTGAATLIVGPLSFVGLMAPHIVRMSGLRGAAVQTVGAGLLGGVLLVFADWLGRILAFPWQVPAGHIATVLGGLYFIWLAVRR